MNIPVLTIISFASTISLAQLITPVRAQGVPVQISLNSITAISANDVWAVGNGVDSQDPDNSDPVFEHWDGNQWSIVPGQRTLDDAETMSGSDATSPNDVWAVGSTGLPLHDDRQIEIEHWDGQTWSFVQAEQVSGNNVLNGVTAISANDVWAVGSQDTQGGVGRNRALIEHWDGSHWSAVPIPDPPGTESLSKVAAVSANDVWAVGSVVPNLKSQPLAMHWDGSSWLVVPVPTVDRDFPLSDVVALASNNVWAVGMVFDFSWPSHSQGIVMHWDGTSWRLVPSPVTGPYDADGLAAITAISPHDIWAIGNSVKQNQQTLAEHWNGRTWKFVSAPNSFVMNDIAAVSSNDVWAVGWMISSSIIEHWDGVRWSIIPSP